MNATVSRISSAAQRLAGFARPGDDDAEHGEREPHGDPSSSPGRAIPYFSSL